MTTIVNQRTSGHDPILGAPPEIVFGTVEPDGTTFENSLPNGTLFIERSSATAAAPTVKLWMKTASNNAASDWQQLAFVP